MNSGKIKRIFISDIHMGDGRSVSPGGAFNPYCWFSGNRPDMLAQFLKQYCLDDESVNEVVIVGDLFDEWICPTQFDPTDRDHSDQQIANIANALQNQLAIGWLKELASHDKKKLIYLRGNHDMLADSTTIQNIFPGIMFLASPDGHDVYEPGDGIRAEHGHWYGLFNAPYPIRSDNGFSNSILPLGFFVSRISAQEALRTGKSSTPFQIFCEWAAHIIGRKPEINDPSKAVDKTLHGEIDGILMELLDTAVKDHIPDQQGAVMNGFDEIPRMLTWQQVKDRYAHIFSEWDGTHKDNVGPFHAIEDDGDSLFAAATHILLNDTKAKVLVCGHTHNWNLKPDIVTTVPSGVVPPVTQNIYANAGAWINDRPHCTFAETESDPAKGSHVVRLREWIRGLTETTRSRICNPT